MNHCRKSKEKESKRKHGEFQIIHTYYEFLGMLSFMYFIHPNVRTNFLAILKKILRLIEGLVYFSHTLQGAKL